MTRLVHPSHLAALPSDAATRLGVWGVFACRSKTGAVGHGRARWVLPDGKTPGALGCESPDRSGDLKAGA